MSLTQPTRRRLLATAAAAPLIGVGVGARAQAVKAPNIVFILADDLGYADVGCYGAPDIKTPNIDRLAAEGVRFTQGYANSAVCSATRTALITGRYQYRLRVGLEEPLDGAVATGLPTSLPTLPSILRKTGYATALIGKWHLGDPPRFGPLQSGYDKFWGFHGAGIDYYAHTRASLKDLWDGDRPIEESGYLTDLIGDHALGVLANYTLGTKPYFLSLHFSAPHWPWEAPGDQAETERLKGKSLVDFDGGSRDVFRRMVERMDDQIGRVLQLIEASGDADNTIVVFTSDNGGERFSDTWPFTGKKTELLEGGLRIPVIVRWPGRLPKGAVSDQVMISMDWFPTLLAAAGAAPDPAYPSDGVNLLPQIAQAAPTRPRQLFWRYKANFQRAMRDGNWKILKIQDSSFLFDVAKDPLERANMKDREPEVFQRMVFAWNFWNRQMLPEVRESFTEGFTGAELADHYGAAFPKPGVDEGDRWP
jgi:arylsulfatase A-like enzyme